MNEEPTGQNTLNTFSSIGYLRKSFTKKVPLYDIFESIDDTIFEVCHK